MNSKIALANPIDPKMIKTGILISSVVTIAYIAWALMTNGLSWVDFIIATFGALLIFYIWNYRQLIRKPKSIEIEGDRLVLHYRFKSNPLTMNLVDIGSIDVSLDGTKINDWIGFDGILTFKVKKPVEWFDIYWKSAIVVREQYKSRFGENPPMRDAFVRKKS